MEELASTDWDTLKTLVRWHGYACIVPEAVAGTQAMGAGSGCWQALKNAAGLQLANLITDCEENGGWQSAWVNHAVPGDGGEVLHVQCSMTLNSDGETMAYYFR